jgi:hypothetical protein
VPDGGEVRAPESVPRRGMEHPVHMVERARCGLVLHPDSDGLAADDRIVSVMPIRGAMQSFGTSACLFPTSLCIEAVAKNPHSIGNDPPHDLEQLLVVFDVREYLFAILVVGLIPQ